MKPSILAAAALTVLFTLTAPGQTDTPAPHARPESTPLGETPRAGEAAVPDVAGVQIANLIQDIDARGPAAIDLLATHFSTLACNAENARRLVVGLHDGSAVAIPEKAGASAVIQPPAKLGYGDTYVAMTLAAETLRQAGIAECATAAQWRAALLGGSLDTGKTGQPSSRSVPGILTLKHQRSDWAAVARTAGVGIDRVQVDANTFASRLDAGKKPLSAAMGPVDPRHVERSASTPDKPRSESTKPPADDTHLPGRSPSP